MPFDKFGIKYFYPSKTGGWNFEMNDNPKNQAGTRWDPELSFPGGGIIRMDPNGPTNFRLGKNIGGFNGSIGGCNMDFSQTADRGYAYKQDDARDVEIKCLLKVSGTSSGEGFSISACTGRHTGSQCCEGFAYMISVDVADNPSSFRFRKEMWHVSYHDSPIGTFTHPKCNFRIRDLGRYVGLGFCRYNDPNNPDTTVILEVWFNPDPDNNINDWTMLKRFSDKNGVGWGNDGDDCGGARDQAGTWSNVMNRFKTNSTSGNILFKAVTLREIDPSKTFGEEPGPGPGPEPQPEPPGLNYTFDFKFGSKGNGDGRFQDPHDITFDSTGANLWVCDRVRNDVQKFTSAGVFVSKFGSAGSGNGQFNVPYALQIDPTFTYLYVCDRENNRVQKLTTSGTFVSSITSANGSLKKPEDICFNPTNGDIFICDTGNDRVVKLNSAHTFLTEWDGSAGGGIQFEHPHSMDITTDNAHICVSCGDQPFIQKFTTSGTFVKRWGSEGNGQGQVRMFLEHMDIDIFNRLHLINNDVRPIINVWDAGTGDWLTQYGKTTAGSADGQFKEPEHVTCDSTGKPYVVDAKNQRIQVFKFSGSVGGGTGNPPPAPPPPPSGGPTKVIGTFTLFRDINQFRTSACEGSSGGGGSGGSSRFYIVPADNDKELADVSAFDYRTRIGAKLKKSGSAMKSKILKQLDVPLKKVGSPAATPRVTAVIWDSNNNPIYTSPTTIDPTTLTTSFVSRSFDFSTNTHEFVVGDSVGIRYYADSSTSDVNYVVGGYQSVTTAGNTVMFQLESGVYDEKPTRDFAADMWD